MKPQKQITSIQTKEKKKPTTGKAEKNTNINKAIKKIKRKKKRKRSDPNWKKDRGFRYQCWASEYLFNVVLLLKKVGNLHSHIFTYKYMDFKLYLYLWMWMEETQPPNLGDENHYRPPSTWLQSLNKLSLFFLSESKQQTGGGSEEGSEQYNRCDFVKKLEFLPFIPLLLLRNNINGTTPVKRGTRHQVSEWCLVVLISYQIDIYVSVSVEIDLNVQSHTITVHIKSNAISQVFRHLSENVTEPGDFRIEIDILTTKLLGVSDSIRKKSKLIVMK